MTHEQTMAYDALCAVGFACLDLNLYLNTHPEDKSALESFNEYSKQFMTLRDDYQKKYGPLNNFGYSQSKYPWEWNKSPWPWEYEGGHH